MAAGVVRLRHDVEEEGLHVVVQRLVVQEQLGQETQVLAVDLGPRRRMRMMMMMKGLKAAFLGNPSS